MELITEVKNTTGFILIKLKFLCFPFPSLIIRIICSMSELQLQEKILDNLT